MTDKGPEEAPYTERKILPDERPLVSIIESISEEDIERQRVVGIGFEITEPNDQFDVKEALFSDSRFDSPEPVKAVYIETEDGNIFRLLRDDNGDGFLQDANMTAESYKSKLEHGEYKGHILEDPHLLSNLIIEIDKPFIWGSFMSSRVTKLTAVIDYIGEPVNIDTQGRNSNIAQRFRNKSRPLPKTQG